MTDSLLSGLQLADSFLPVGHYSSSYALEQFVEAGRVTDVDDVGDLLARFLRNQLGTMDLVALRDAHRRVESGSIDGLVRTDERVHAMTMPVEFRQSATRTGTQLCDLWLSIGDESPVLRRYADRDPPMQYAVVQGAVAGAEGLTARRACVVYCYGFCSSMLGAAQRLLSLGHTDVQDCLRGTRSLIMEVVEASDGRCVSEISSYTPAIEIHSAAHERADRRLFTS